MLRRRKTLVVAAGVLLLCAGVVRLYQLVLARSPTAAAIATADIVRATLRRTVSDSGSVQPNTTTVYAGTPGTLTSVPYVGQHVTAGETVAVAENPQLNHQLAVDEAALATDQADLRAARASLRGVGLGRGGTVTVPAGHAGSVVAVDVQPGQQVGAGDTIAQLASGGDLLLDATVDLADARNQGYYGAPAVGQRALVGAAGQSIDGTIVSVSASGSGNAASDAVVVRFADPGGLVPGTPGSVTLLPAGRTAGTALPVEGSIAADVNVTLVSPVAGTVERVPIAPGQSVAASSTAAVIRAPSTASALAGDRNASARDAADVAYDRRQLAALRIASPVAGIVSEVQVSVGQPVGVGTPLAQVTALHGLTATVQVDESDVPHLRVGEPVPVRLPALGATVKARLEAIGPDGTNQNGVGLFPVTLDLPSAAGGHPVLPGMTVEADFLIAEVRDALAAPLAAVHHLDGRSVLLVRQGGQIDAQPVNLGLATSTRVQILNGAQAGETVVTTSLKDLTKFGQRFRVSGRVLRRRPAPRAKRARAVRLRPHGKP